MLKMIVMIDDHKNYNDFSVMEVCDSFAQFQPNAGFGVSYERRLVHAGVVDALYFSAPICSLFQMPKHVTSLSVQMLSQHIDDMADKMVELVNSMKRVALCSL